MVEINHIGKWSQGYSYSCWHFTTEVLSSNLDVDYGQYLIQHFRDTVEEYLNAITISGYGSVSNHIIKQITILKSAERFVVCHGWSENVVAKTGCQPISSPIFFLDNLKPYGSLSKWIPSSRVVKGIQFQVFVLYIPAYWLGKRLNNLCWMSFDKSANQIEATDY